MMMPPAGGSTGTHPADNPKTRLLVVGEGVRKADAQVPGANAKGMARMALVEGGEVTLVSRRPKRS